MSTRTKGWIGWGLAGTLLGLSAFLVGTMFAPSPLPARADDIDSATCLSDGGRCGYLQSAPCTPPQDCTCVLILDRWRCAAKIEPEFVPTIYESPSGYCLKPRFVGRCYKFTDCVPEPGEQNCERTKKCIIGPWVAEYSSGTEWYDSGMTGCKQ